MYRRIYRRLCIHNNNIFRNPNFLVQTPSKTALNYHRMYRNKYYVDQNLNLFPITPPLSSEMIASFLMVSCNLFVIGSLTFLMILCFRYFYQLLCMITGTDICEKQIMYVSVISVKICIIAVVLYKMFKK